MNTYFQSWIEGPDDILSDLARRYINRKVFKSITFKSHQENQLDKLRSLVADVGFDPEYYTSIHHNFDLPYDIYRPNAKKKRTQIEIYRKDTSLVELSSLSPIVHSLAGTIHGDSRFYFPKEMLEDTGIFSSQTELFTSYIHNDHFIIGETHDH